jgi:hypothetical protein
MDARPARRFTLADGMALVAASGVGFALRRFVDDLAPVSLGWQWKVEAWAWAMALPITLALTILCLFDRKAPRRRFLAPGVAACLAASIASIFTLALEADILVWIIGMNNRLLWKEEVWTLLLPRQKAVGVAGAWTALALSRRWRPEPGWIDRTGIGLGILWIASMLAIPVLNLLAS